MVTTDIIESGSSGATEISEDVSAISTADSEVCTVVVVGTGGFGTAYRTAECIASSSIA